MNRLSKFTLLVAILLCIAGGIFLLIGVTSGGISFASSINKEAPGRGSYKYYQMKKTKLDDFNSLKMDFDYLDISILPSEDDSCYLAYNISGSKKKNPFSYTIKNGVLTMTQQDSGESNFFIGIDYTFLSRFLTGTVTKDPAYYKEYVTLYLPAGKTLESAALSLNDGDITIDGLKANQLTADSEYGDVVLKNVTAKDSNFHIADGDISLNAFTSSYAALTLSYGDMTISDSSLGSIALQSGDGDCTWQNSTFTKTADFRLSYGDITFRFSDEQKKNLSFSLRTSYGDISLPAGRRQDLVRDYEDEDIKRYESEGVLPENLLSVNTEDGDIVIQ